MNINEVSMLDVNFWVSYPRPPSPYVRIQIGNHAWYLSKGIIMESLDPYTPYQSSAYLFGWVLE